jgi:hypothetical protein
MRVGFKKEKHMPGGIDKAAMGEEVGQERKK